MTIDASRAGGVKLDDGTMFHVWNKSSEEMHLDLVHCRCPAVIAVKYSQMTAEEQINFHSSVLDAMIAAEKIKLKQLQNAKPQQTPKQSARPRSC